MLDAHNVQRDITFMLCGDQIGVGQYRTVYENRMMPETVVKVENVYGCFHNIMEWHVWQAVKDTKNAKWFAPCEWISGNGTVLIMRKTKPADKLPLRVPSFFEDLKDTNWGVMDGRVVCHDYGISNIIEYGVQTGLKKAAWA